MALPQSVLHSTLLRLPNLAHTTLRYSNILILGWYHDFVPRFCQSVLVGRVGLQPKWNIWRFHVCNEDLNEKPEIFTDPVVGKINRAINCFVIEDDEYMTLEIGTHRKSNYGVVQGIKTKLNNIINGLWPCLPPLSFQIKMYSYYVLWNC